MGRQRELQVFEMALRDLLDGEGGALVLTGEAGIGKTRLLEAMQARVAGVAEVFETRCLEGIVSPAYSPWIKILRELGAWAEGEGALAEVATRLGEQLSLGQEKRSFAVDSRFAVFDELATFMRSICTNRPVVLAFDDLHLADPASVLALQAVLGRLRGARLLVLAAYRDTGLERGSELAPLLQRLGRAGRRLPLSGFGPAEVAEFLSGAGHCPDEMVVETLWRRSGGNPFFLREIIGFLKDAVDPGALPPGARDAVLQRLHPLPPQACQAIDAAAILGDEAAVGVLQAMLGMESPHLVLEALEPAREMDLIRLSGESHETFVFRHAIVREAIYESIAVSRRAKLHAAAARGLRELWGENDAGRLDEIVHHALCALPEGDPNDVARLACRAADNAARSYAYERAATYLRSALDALARVGGRNGPETDRHRLDLLLRLAGILERGDHRERCRAAYVEAARLARALADPASLARSAIGLYPRGDIAVSPAAADLASMREALEELGDDCSELRVELLGRLAKAQYYSADLKLRDELTAEAVAIAERSDDEFLVATARVSRHFAIWGPDEVSDRGAAASRAAELGRHVGDPDVVFGALFWRLTDALERGAVADAETDIENFGALAETRREPFYLWRTATFRAARMLLSGRFLEAERAIEEARVLGVEASSPNVDLTYGVQRALLLQERGDSEGALALRRPVADSMRGLSTGPCLLLGGLVEAGREQEARRLFANLAVEGFALRRDQSWLFSMIQLARACVGFGSPEEAGVLFERLRPFADRIALVGWFDACEGSVARWVGLLARKAGHQEAARRHLAQALHGNRRLGAWPHVARVEIELAALLWEAGSGADRHEAQKLAAHSFETAQRLGMDELAARAFQLTEDHSAKSALAPRQTSVPRFSPDGELFRLEFEGRACVVKAAKGVRYLAFLLERPHEGVHVLDMRVVVNGQPTIPPSARRYAQMSADHLALEGLHRSRAGTRPVEGGDAPQTAHSRTLLASLQEALVSAEGHGDEARATLLREEIDRVTARLMGRYAEASDDAERARKAVTNAIRYSIGRIRHADAALGRYLDIHVRTGTFCRYDP